MIFRIIRESIAVVPFRRYAVHGALLIAIAAYLISYLNNPALPHSTGSQPNGWWGWYDQGEYYRTTESLATGHLEPSVYWYGYPLLGAAFFHLLPLHPYLLPNLAIYCIVICTFYQAFRGFVGEVEAAVAAVILVVGSPLLLQNVFVVPWTTIPVHGTFCILTVWFVFGRASILRMLVASVLVGYCLFCRPSDAVFLLILYGIGVFSLGRTIDRVIAIIGVGATCALSLGVTMAINFHLYGSPGPPTYLAMVKSVGFDWSNLPFKFYQIVIDGAVLAGNASLPPGTVTNSILRCAPWLLFSFPGAVALILHLGWRFVAFLFSVAAYVVFYLGFNPVSSSAQFWSYSLYHYFWILLPWLGVISYASVRLAPKMLRPLTFAALAILPAGLVFICSFEARVRDVVVIDGDYTYLPKTKTQALARAEVSTTDPSWALSLSYPQPTALRGVRLFPLGGTVQHYSVAGAELQVSITGDGKPLAAWHDFVVSQNTKCINVLFMNQAVRNQPVRDLKITFSKKPAQQVVYAETLELSWSPGKALRRLFARISPSVEDPVPSQPLQVKNGSVLDIGAGARGSLLLAGGWSSPEAGYTWTEGRESVLRFTVAPNDLPANMWIKGNTLGNQRTVIYVNDRKTSEISGDFSTIPFERMVPLTLADRGSDGTVLIRLENLTCKSPASFGMNSDQRLLALAVRQISFSSSEIKQP